MILKLSVYLNLAKGRRRATAELGRWIVKNCWSSCLLCSSCYIVSLDAGLKEQQLAIT
ncbi:hypothetical protein CsSME_00022608 [Camellia sinensis var. sinensis]